MKKLNEMFHIDGERLIKSSNGQEIPAEEPIFILRARDCVALYALTAYREESLEIGSPADRIAALDGVIDQFRAYALAHPTKIPGSTHGR